MNFRYLQITADSLHGNLWKSLRNTDRQANGSVHHSRADAGENIDAEDIDLLAALFFPHILHTHMEDIVLLILVETISLLHLLASIVLIIHSKLPIRGLLQLYIGNQTIDLDPPITAIIALRLL